MRLQAGTANAGVTKRAAETSALPSKADIHAAASLALDGQQEEAADAVATLRKLMPEMSLTLIRLSVPYTVKTMEPFLDGLRKAGVPE